jgi:hypothetical protein
MRQAGLTAPANNYHCYCYCYRSYCRYNHDIETLRQVSDVMVLRLRGTKRRRDETRESLVDVPVALS